MARFSIYVSDEELLWLKDKQPGWLRALVQREMRGGATHRTDPLADQLVRKAERVSVPVESIPGLKECPRCGTLITEKQTAHGKCGWKQS